MHHNFPSRFDFLVTVKGYCYSTLFTNDGAKDVFLSTRGGGNM